MGTAACTTPCAVQWLKSWRNSTSPLSLRRSALSPARISSVRSAGMELVRFPSKKLYSTSSRRLFVFRMLETLGITRSIKAVIYAPSAPQPENAIRRTLRARGDQIRSKLPPTAKPWMRSESDLTKQGKVRGSRLKYYSNEHTRRN